MFCKLLRQWGCRQNSSPELHVFKVDVSAVDGSNAGILEGSELATISKSATGHYVLTLNQVARRDLCFLGGVALSPTGNLANEATLYEVVPATTSQIQMGITTDAGIEVDYDITFSVAAFYSDR